MLKLKALCAGIVPVRTILHNLCTNALQAMQNTGGVLTVNLKKTARKIAKFEEKIIKIQNEILKLNGNKQENLKRVKELDIYINMNIIEASKQEALTVSYDSDSDFDN